MKGKAEHFFIVVFAAASAFLSAQSLAHADAAHKGQAESKHATGLVKEVLDSTRRFKDVSVAMAENYGAFLGCVSGPQEGAMGVHFVNGDLVGDHMLDATQPEILVYEPLKNGRLRLVAVEYLVIAEGWHATNELPPTLSGQVFHYSGSPNRYGLPPFYALHVWAWKANPHGEFVDWNPKVSCADYSPVS